MKAVDIYNGTHNRGINFSRVKAAGYDMAIVKATEGVSYTDPSFTVNVDGAALISKLPQSPQLVQFAYGMGRSRRWKQNNDSVYRNLSERCGI